MMDQGRIEIGLACFGRRPDNEFLWQRYAGLGAGVCIEFDVPSELLGAQLHLVHYLDEKRIHINELISAFLVRGSGRAVYEAARPDAKGDDQPPKPRPLAGAGKD